MYLCKTCEGWSLLAAPARHVIARLLAPVIVEDREERVPGDDYL